MLPHTTTLVGGGAQRHVSGTGSIAYDVRLRFGASRRRNAQVRGGFRLFHRAGGSRRRRPRRVDLLRFAAPVAQARRPRLLRHRRSPLPRLPPVRSRASTGRSAGRYYFVGDPTPFGYDGPRYSFYGPHPIADVNVTFGAPTYCYLKGPHYHWYAPPPTAQFEMRGGAYWYVGAYEPVFYAEQPRFVVGQRGLRPAGLRASDHRRRHRAARVSRRDRRGGRRAVVRRRRHRAAGTRDPAGTAAPIGRRREMVMHERHEEWRHEEHRGWEHGPRLARRSRARPRLARWPRPGPRLARWPSAGGRDLPRRAPARRRDLPRRRQPGGGAAFHGGGGPGGPAFHGGGGPAPHAQPAFHGGGGPAPHGGGGPAPHGGGGPHNNFHR